MIRLYIALTFDSIVLGLYIKTHIALVWILAVVPVVACRSILSNCIGVRILLHHLSLRNVSFKIVEDLFSLLWSDGWVQFELILIYKLLDVHIRWHLDWLPTLKNDLLKGLLLLLW